MTNLTTSVMNGEIARDIYDADDNAWVHGYRKIDDVEKDIDERREQRQVLYIDPNDDKHWAFEYTIHHGDGEYGFPWKVYNKEPADVDVDVYRVEPFIVGRFEWRKVS